MISWIVAGVSRSGQAIFGWASGIWTTIKTAFSGGIAGIGALILNWSPLGLFYNAFAPVLSWFGVELPAKFSEIGGAIVAGMIGGIGGAIGKLIESAKALSAKVAGAVKGALGIKSPSKVFAEIGGFTMLGLNEGLLAKLQQPLNTVKGFAANMVAAGAVALSPITARATTGSIAGAPGSAAGGVGQTIIQITVNPSPGMDEKKLAELVAQKIKEPQLTAAARTRSRLTDSD